MKQRVPLQSACKSFEEDLVLYYYGETDEVEQRRVQQHLSQCVSCQGFLDDLRRWLPQIAKSEPMAPAFWEDYYRETVAKLTRQEEHKHWWRALFAPRPMWMVPAFGTVGVAVLVVGLLFGKGNLSFIYTAAGGKNSAGNIGRRKSIAILRIHGLARITGQAREAG